MDITKEFLSLKEVADFLGLISDNIGKSDCKRTYL